MGWWRSNTTWLQIVAELLVWPDCRLLQKFVCSNLFSWQEATPGINNTRQYWLEPGWKSCQAYILDKFNTLRPKQNGCHFADDIFKCIFLNENEWILFKVSLKFVLKGPISIIPALVQIMAWRRPGDKPLSEPMMVSLPMHICVTRTQCSTLCNKAPWKNNLRNGLIRKSKDCVYGKWKYKLLKLT